MSTLAERKVLVPKEVRVVFVPGYDVNRTVLVPTEDRVVIIEKYATTSAERTVYANED